MEDLDTVRAALSAVADRMPPPRFPDRAWRRGRRRRVVRRGAVALTVIVVLLTVPLWWPGAGHHRAEPATPDGSSGVLPSRAAAATFGRPTIASSPPGPAVLVYDDDRPFTLDETETVAVGRDGRYRVRDQVRGHSRGHVSPDGRRLLEGYDRVLDLTTGEITRLNGAHPSTWSRDGNTVAAVENDSTVNLIDLGTGRVRISHAVHGTISRAGPAIAPDGDTVVVPVAGGDVGEHRLIRIDPAGPVRWDVPVNGFFLDDPVVFSPDGRQLATTVDHCDARTRNCPGDHLGRAVVLDAATGAEVRRLGRADRVLGFRDGDVVALRFGTGETTVVQLGPGAERTLMTLDKDMVNPDIPLDLVEHGTFGGRADWPDRFEASWWVWGMFTAAGLPVVWLAWRIGRRVRAQMR
ncbi:WD40 repeat domain-containing protein [Dactylosporangium matsuzakiense]|uniref:WD40 repeat protein n=1 Tax=Dactylosporangium matsuzakiense TaxID=53360 RepID=A0A9W6KHS8_9ACTN|nr:hypothetical protein [Dactylosporangium matsuzakiense]UWZ41083.1 hypothetical protein Dmats_25545 [Dactylosporangium matsuzakiense]GLL01020.1 hypothetical protein GCM10017581_027610 [Dactylosporangium matsuzakiense]